jgi:hypothetical protein
MRNHFKSIAILLAVSAGVIVTGCTFNPSSSTPDITPSCGGTSNGYFNIYYPGHSQSLRMQTTDSIMWTNLISPLPSYVTISLYKNQDFVRTLATGVSNLGILSRISVPSVGTGSNYRIKVQSTADSTKYDFSCNFNLYSDYTGGFTFSNPTASSACTTGKTFQIQWQSTGTPGNYVTLQLFDGKDSSYIVSSISTSSGVYNWSVPMGLAAKSTYRIKITSYYDPSISTFSNAFSIVGMAPDSYEPDGKRDAASTGTLGTPQSHNLTLNDTDWVKLTLDSGKTYLVQSSGGIATRIFLFYASETSYSDVLYSTTNTASYLWVCPKAGVWYARISAALSNPTPAAYTFTASVYDSLSLATVTSPGNGTTWAAGSSYQIQWIPDSTVLGPYVYLYLYKGSQQLMYVYSSSLSNSGVYSWYIPSGLATGGDYRIKVANYSNASMAGYSNFFTISGVSPDAYEPDNIRDMASTYASVQSHSLTLNDTDWVKFKADSGAIYLLQSFGNIATMVYLFSGEAVSYTTYFYTSSTSSPASTQWPCYKSGDYYARISAYSSGTYGGTYSFTATKYDSLAMVTFAAPTVGATWAAGSSYQVRWIPDTSVLGTSVYLYLYKGSQQVTYIYSSSLSNSGSYTWTIPSGLSTGSDYRIKIANYNNSTLGGFSPSFTISGAAPDAYEPDNQRSSASTLSPLGKAQSHNFTMNDTDWVKFSLDSGRTYILQSSGGTRVYLYYGSEVSTTASFYSSSTSSPALRQLTAYKTGIYYACITPYSSSTYGMTYSFIATAYDSLAMITFSSPLASSVWSTGSSYRIQWIPDSVVLGTYVYLYLYKADRYVQYVYSSTVSNSGYYDWSVPAGLASGSDYRIKVLNGSNSVLGGYSPAFSISGIAVDAYEPDDSLSKASVITPNAAAQNRSLTLSDVDWISFAAQKDSIYAISGASSASGTLSSFYIYLYNTTGSSYLASQYGTAPKIVWTCPSSGTYYLRVNPYSTSYYGAYSISIKKYSSTVSVTFINPTAQSVWSAGSSYSIQWVADSALFGTYVRLQLHSDTTYVQLITSSTSNSGAYSWTPPLGITTGKKYTIRLSSTSSTLLAGYSAAFSISGLDPDAYEPDDSSALAHTIATTGTPESHTITSLDKDWYKFSAVANHLYAIKTTGATRSMSTQVGLYGTDGKTLNSSAYSSTTDSSATLLMFCSVAGAYFFNVTSSTYGTYVASVTGYDSTKFGLTVATPLTGASLTLGQTSIVTWSGQINAGGTVDIFLFNTAGVVLNIAVNATNNGSYSWTVPTTATPGTDYYVKVISRVNSNIYGSSGVFKIITN